MPIQKLQLIGGAPLTGKTTLAAKLGAANSAVVLSTDNIRSWMQSVCSTEDFPHLFSSYNLGAEQYYQKFPTAKAAFEEEVAQSRDVEAGVLELVSIWDLPWSSVVLEGIAITPEFATTLKEKLRTIEYSTTFLYDGNRDRIKSRVYERGLWAAAGTYSNDIKPIEVEWTIMYNEWYQAQAQQYDYKITPVLEEQL